LLTLRPYQAFSPSLSVFELITDIPGQFLRYKRTMIDISNVIEDTAAKHTPACLMWVGFQKFSLFAAQEQRYRRLAQSWKHCWIFGVDDAPLPELPNVTPVAVTPDHPLAKEWFVIADGPSFGSALLAADTSGFAIADRQRKFMGLWSADPALVRRASSRLAQAIDEPAPFWKIDCASTLRAYDQMANWLVAAQEERTVAHSRKHQS
jgi:DICT domain-containing protein